MAADLKPADRMLLECIRGEFNNQPREERIRTADFMDFEAVTELLRERAHATQAVHRIDGRIATVLSSIRRRRADDHATEPTPCPECHNANGHYEGCGRGFVPSGAEGGDRG